MEHGLGPVSSFRRAGISRLRAFQLSAMRWVASASYVRKWVVLGSAIGAIAAVGMARAIARAAMQATSLPALGLPAWRDFRGYE